MKRHKVLKYLKLARLLTAAVVFCLTGCNSSENTPTATIGSKAPPIPIKQPPSPQTLPAPEGVAQPQGTPAGAPSPVAAVPVSAPVSTSLTGNGGGTRGASANVQNEPEPPQLYNHKEEEQPLFVDGEKSFNLEPYRVPSIVLQRQAVEEGSAGAPPDEPLFHVHRASLVMDLKKDEMRLDLDIEGREMNREQVTLSGKFDRHASTWSANLFATDPVTRQERRVQAVVLCRRPFICDRVYMDLYYVVKGESKPVRRQFNVGVKKAMIPYSEEQSVYIDYDTQEQKITIPDLSGVDATPAPSPAPPQETGSGQSPDKNLRPRPRPKKDTPPEASAAPQPLQPPPPSPGSSPAAPTPNPAMPPPPDSQPPGSPNEPQRESTPPAAQGPPAPGAVKDNGFQQSPPMSRPPIEVDLKKAVIVYETEADLSAYTDATSSDSLREIELPQVEGDEKDQAIGSHTSGSLQNATEFKNNPDCGILRRAAAGQFWSTEYLISFLNRAACAVQKALGNSTSAPLRVGGLSKKFGGDFGSHSSHQNGLDADIYFYRTKPHDGAWSPSSDNWKSFDYARNWQFLVELQKQSTPRARPFSFKKPGKGVLAIFVNPGIKQKFCEYVERERGLPSDKATAEHRALKYLVTYYKSGEAVSGHGNHYHIRVFCPNWGAKDNECNNSEVSAPVEGNSTGC